MDNNEQNKKNEQRKDTSKNGNSFLSEDRKIAWIEIVARSRRCQNLPAIPVKEMKSWVMDWEALNQRVPTEELEKIANVCFQHGEYRADHIYQRWVQNRMLQTGYLQVADPKCNNCYGTGWVSENNVSKVCDCRGR